MFEVDGNQDALRTFQSLTVLLAVPVKRLEYVLAVDGLALEYAAIDLELLDEFPAGILNDVHGGVVHEEQLLCLAGLVLEE